MSLDFLRTTVSFSEARAIEIDRLCAARGMTRTALIRDAVNAYLDPNAGAQANLERMAMMLEFTHVAVDILIRKQAPDRRDEILTTVHERMEMYHAK